MTGGKRPDGKGFERGFWIEPTVFADVTEDMRIAMEEIFGPVLSVFKWSDEDEVIRIANSVEYGRSDAVWSKDRRTALRTAQRVATGYIWCDGVWPP